jgi:hypothetical protein
MNNNAARLLDRPAFVGWRIIDSGPPWRLLANGDKYWSHWYYTKLNKLAEDTYG